MRRGLLGALALGALSGVSSPARADDLSFDLPVFGRTTFAMTSTTTARFRGPNHDRNAFDDDFFTLGQRFDLSLQGDELRFELRLDAFVPFALWETHTDSPAFPGGFTRPAFFGSVTGCPEGIEERCYLAWDVRPERFVLRWDHESWSIELGDAQLVFGRGAALSFRKADLLAVDNALRGVHVRFDDGHFRFRLHGGVANPQNQDPITLAIFQDPLDIVVGATVGATFGPSDMFQVSGHALRIWFEDDESAYQGRAVDVAGWTAEMPNLFDGHLALYAEANGLRRTSTLFDTEVRETGRSVYASAQLQLDNATLLIEWADYRNFLVASETHESRAYRTYGNAPTLEFDGGPQRSRAFGNRRGGALRFDYAFLPGPWQVGANLSLYGFAEGNDDPWDGVLVGHGWLTLQKRQEYDPSFSWSLLANLGYREESLLRTTPTLPAGATDRRMVHGQVDLTVGSGDHSLDIVLDHRYELWRPGGAEATEFQVGGASLTYTLGVQLALTVGLRYSDFKPDEVRSREVMGLGGAWYPSLEARWNFDPGTFVRLFVGSTPGGVLCSGGVCRDVPPFEGALVQFVGRL